ncbi:hypothetical protein OG689_29140 [Kitasatospora sp. NBC_00240]|uniref:hypothetical protein n=1 Tax=Kitasatospora sp. NBC_00240 TaxID=2903567 RepID=UPI0022598264|nr:hypothetical protein [Kitasatospora sp. NBC_00240]MCX5213282.1 hypothetical protein [Kitasatospora sp. NBC_00240]
MDDLEHELARLLAESVEDLRPPVAVMVAEANLRGRRLLLRRRLRIAGSVVAVGALALTGAVLGLPERPAGPAAAADRVPAPTSAAPTTPPSATAGTPSTTALESAMQKALAELIGPRAAVTSDPLGDEIRPDPRRDAALWVRYDDGDGAVTVAVELHGPASTAPGPSCGARASAAPDAGYTCRTEAAGPGTLVTEVLNPSATGWITYRIWYAGPDGTRVAVSVHNGTLHEPTDPTLSGRRTRTNPPLDLGTWQWIAQNYRWQSLAEDRMDRGPAAADRDGP